MAQSRRKGRSGAALVVSVAVHGVILLLLARAVPVLPTVGREEPFQIELVPAFAPPQTETETPAEPAPADLAPPAAAPTRSTPSRRAPLRQAPPRHAAVRQSPPPRTAPRPAPAQVPIAPPTSGRSAAPPTPSRASNAVTSGQASASSGAAQGPRTGPQRATANLPGDESAGGVKQFLRETVGCSHQDFLHLTVAERNECERQNGVQASIGAHQRLDAIPAGKRGYYDSVQQAYQALHRYETPLDTGAGGRGASAPGHGPSFGCIHGKCGVISPEGVLTEESGTDPH